MPKAKTNPPVETGTGEPPKSKIEFADAPPINQNLSNEVKAKLLDSLGLLDGLLSNFFTNITTAAAAATSDFRYSVYQTEFNSDDLRRTLNMMLDEKIEEIEIHNYGGIVLCVGKRFLIPSDVPPPEAQAATAPPLESVYEKPS